MFLHLFVSLARNRTEGEPIPYCSKLPAHYTFKTGVLPGNTTTESIKLPAQHTAKLEFFSCSKPARSTTAHTPAVAIPKTLLVSYVALVS